MALTFNPTSPRAEAQARRTAPHSALDTAPTAAITRQREARAWLTRGQAADREAQVCYTRALATDINLQEAWQAAAKRWPHQGNNIDYRRLAHTLLEEREKKQMEQEALTRADQATLTAIALSLLGLVGALGFLLGAWLL